MLLGILLAVLIVVCLALVGVILLQRSEGGALGMSGGGPGAFMTARGTGDLLTRTTQILAGVFFALCLTMTLISGHERNASELIQKVKGLPAASAAAPVSAAPASAAPAQQPVNPFAQTQPFAQPAQPAPRQSNNPLDLLGTTQQPQARPQAPVAVPQAQPAAQSSAPAAKTKHPPKHEPATSGAPPAPIVQAPAPVLPPPAQSAAPSNQ